MRLYPSHLLLPLVMGLALLTPAAESEACGNEVELRVDPRIELVARAERSTGEGKHRAALQALAKAIPQDQVKLGLSGLTDRGYVTAALAVARSDGRYDWKGQEASPEKGTSENLRVALDIVKHFHGKKPDDPTAATNYAEVLSHTPGGAREAITILERLEAKDVVASAYGYAALSRLRERAGEGAPAFIAPALAAMERAPHAISMARCERMAADKSICKGESVDKMTQPASAASLAPPPARPRSRSLELAL